MLPAMQTVPWQSSGDWNEQRPENPMKVFSVWPAGIREK
jgi:hypothetical protein